MRRSRRARRLHGGGELMLAAMVDMMVNILIFLLTFYGTLPTHVQQASSDLELPKSQAQNPIVIAPVVAVTMGGITIDGELAVAMSAESTSERLDEKDIKLVQDLLARKAVEAGDAAKVRGVEPTGEVVIECDRRVSWSVLSKVLRAAQSAGLGQYRFVVLRGNEE